MLPCVKFSILLGANCSIGWLNSLYRWVRLRLQPWSNHMLRSVASSKYPYSIMLHPACDSRSTGMKDDWKRRLVPVRKAVVLIRISVGLMFITQGFDEGRQD
jgi:hypothetical protein